MVEVETMTSQELLEKKSKIDIQLREKKAALYDAQCVFARTGRRLDPVTYANLETSISRLKKESQALQLQIRDANASERKAEQLTFDRMFVAVAREKLSKDDFVMLVNATKERLEKQDAPD